MEMVGRESDAFLARHGYVREGGRYRIERPNRDRLAIFCHGGFGLWWLSHLLEIPLPLIFSGFFLPPTSVTTVLMDERSSNWAVPRCLGVGDVSHLYAAGLPVSNSGVKANCD
jgi:probable phosphoglycerate mutase